MHSTLTYVQEIIPGRASVVDRLSHRKRLVAVTTVDITAALVLPVTFGSTRITHTRKGKSVTDTGLDVQLTIASDSLPESVYSVWNR